MMRPKPPFCFFVDDCRSCFFSLWTSFFLAETLLVDEHCSLCRLL